MSVIIRLQNLPWSANALDIRNYFRGLSIPEGGVHIVGGELGDAFIAFSTDEDARQAMMLDGGKIKEIQVKLLLSSRSEMHKVIEAARQTVPILSLAPSVASAPVPAPAPAPVPPVSQSTPLPQPTPPTSIAFPSLLSSTRLNFGIPGLGNPQEIPQPAVIEPPAPLISPQSKTPEDEDRDDDKSETKRKDRRRSRSHSRSRDRDRKDRKRDRRDRSRSRERRRRDRSRSRERRDRKRDRKDRSRSRDRSPKRSRDKRNLDRRSPQSSQERTTADKVSDGLPQTLLPPFPNTPVNQAHNNGQPQMGMMQSNPALLSGPMGQIKPQDAQSRFTDPALKEAFNRLQELGKKRNPNAFQGDQNNAGGRFVGGRGGNNSRGAGNMRRESRQSRFDDQPRNCCVAIRNAPNHTSYGDVRRFFPFMIDKHGIKMINDNMGRRTGSIFVRFCEPRARQMALQKQPNELKGSLVVVESLDDEAFDSAVDSYLPYREDNDDGDHNSNVDQDNRRPSFKFSVLKLGDLPNFVKEHDIVKAFSDFSLLSILLKDCRLTRTKIAYVQFVVPDDARKALERKESYLFGRRVPVITPVTDEEYEQEKTSNDKIVSEDDRMMKNDMGQEPVVPRDPRQRRQQNDNGMAPQAPMQSQAQPPFFPPNGPFHQNFNAPFPNPQFGVFSPGNMDPRAAAATWANRPPFPKKKDPVHVTPPNPHVINLDSDDEPLDCVLMKGLPREATDRTILDFLSDTGAVPARIHLMLDGGGRPSGDCFCEFRTPEEARQAATKHGTNLDGNRITVDLVMHSVVEEALEGPKMDTKRDLLGNGPLISTPPGPPVPQFFDAPRENFSARGQFRGRGGYQRGFDRGGFNRGGFDGGRGSFRGRGAWPDRGRGFDRGRGRGFGRGRGGFDMGRDREKFDNNREQNDEDPGLEDFGAPGCVVGLENVPFRATVDDILAFFSDFELTQDDVIRRYNERGQPTGDARVAFPTPALAQRAVATRNMNTIFERRVSLTLL